MNDIYSNDTMLASMEEQFQFVLGVAACSELVKGFSIRGRGRNTNKSAYRNGKNKEASNHTTKALTVYKMDERVTSGTCGTMCR